MFKYETQIPAHYGHAAEDVVLTFKDIAYIPIGVARQNRDASRETQLWAEFEWGLSDNDLAVLDRIPQPQLLGIYTAWKKAEGIDAGESGASSASSTDTVRHSKPTSSETDSG